MKRIHRTQRIVFNKFYRSRDHRRGYLQNRRIADIFQQLFFYGTLIGIG